MQNLFFEASTTINLPQESEKPLLCCKSSQDSISKLGDTRVFLNKEKRVSMNVLFSSLRRDFAVLLQVTAPGTEYQRCCSKWLNICWSQGKRKNNKKREHCSRQGHKLVNELDLKPQQKKQHLPWMGRKHNICQIHRGASAEAGGCSELQQRVTKARLPSPQSDSFTMSCMAQTSWKGLNRRRIPWKQGRAVPQGEPDCCLPPPVPPGVRFLPQKSFL